MKSLIGSLGLRCPRLKKSKVIVHLSGGHLLAVTPCRLEYRAQCGLDGLVMFRVSVAFLEMLAECCHADFL
eukprot:9489856-Pyramimonas_sp.AAC.1